MKYTGVLMALSVLLSAFSLKGQSGDTVRLQPVTINATPIEKLSGYKTTVIDTLALRTLDYESFSELLAKHTPVFIKTYGQGHLATASFRGTAASHTKVLWNGVELNNPMLGQADFSQIPVAIAGSVSLAHGGAGISSGSGSLGGSINIENNPDWSNELQVSLKQTAASFGNYRTQADVKAGNEHVMSRTLFITHSAENNYSFKNIYKDRENPPVELRRNAGYDNHVVMQELYYRDKQQNSFAARVWGQKNFREIAPPLGVEHSRREEQQQNETIRAMAEWERKVDAYEITVKSAYSYDYLNYQNPVASINSDNYAYQFTQLGSMRTSISSSLRFFTDISYVSTRVHSGNYSGARTRNDLTAFAGGHWSPGDDLNIRLMLRQKIIDGALVPLIPSLGIDYRLPAHRNLLFKANVSRNYRMPSLNDLYWQPGGDPQLNPEKGFSWEAGLKYGSGNQKSWSGGAEMTYFLSHISNWISWQPDSVMSYWTPQNLSEVSSRGVEARYHLNVKAGGWKGGWEQSYTYTSAQNTGGSAATYSRGKQLIYIPKHTFQSSFNGAYRNFLIDIAHHYTGRRYTTSDNSSYMPAFSTVDLAFGKTLHFNTIEGTLLLKVNNITDTDYQVVAWYPMPGRNYQLSLSIKFTDP